jgi:hypothetical protein
MLHQLLLALFRRAAKVGFGYVLEATKASRWRTMSDRNRSFSAALGLVVVLIALTAIAAAVAP